jgi:hypothetical protein
MTVVRSVWAFLFVFILSATHVHGAAFYEQPVDPSQFLLGSQSFGVEQQVTDNFALPADQVLGHLTWWGGLVGSQREAKTSRSFVIRLFNSSGAVPAAVPFYEHLGTATVQSTGVVSTYPGWNPSFTIIKYDLDVPAVQLSAGSNYWLSVLNAEQPSGAGVQWGWYAARFVPAQTVFTRDGNSGTWASVDEPERNAMSFALSVPEPATLIFAPASLWLLARRRLRPPY